MKKINAKLIAAGMLLGVATSTSAAGYGVQTLSVPGAATRMSGNGSIVGNYVTKCGTFTYGPHEKGTICYYAPWFSNGKSVTKLGNLWSGSRSAAVDISDAMDLTGSDGSGAWFYSGNKLTRLTGGSPAAINNAGLVVGNASNGSVNKAVRFLNNVGIELTFSNSDPLADYLNLPNIATTAVDVNNSGLIAGWYKDTSNIQQTFVVDANGVLTIIPNLGGATALNCQPVRISEVNPAIPQQAWLAGNCSGRAFIYDVFGSGNPIELSNVSGGSNLSVASVNSKGEAVGTTVINNVVTVLMWSAGGNGAPVNLNPIISTAPMINLRAIDIDEVGNILVDYLDSQYNRITDLLQPTP